MGERELRPMTRNKNLRFAVTLSTTTKAIAPSTLSTNPILRGARRRARALINKGWKRAELKIVEERRNFGLFNGAWTAVREHAF